MPKEKDSKKEAKNLKESININFNFLRLTFPDLFSKNFHLCQPKIMLNYNKFDNSTTED